MSDGECSQNGTPPITLGVCHVDMQSQGLPGGGHWHSANDIASEGSYYIGDIFTTYNICVYQLKYLSKSSIRSLATMGWNSAIMDALVVSDRIQ